MTSNVVPKISHQTGSQQNAILMASIHVALNETGVAAQTTTVHARVAQIIEEKVEYVCMYVFIIDIAR